MGDNTTMSTSDLSRRSVIKRAAVVGAATAWATPTIQSIASPAFAAGSPPGACGSCMTGGGQIVTMAGAPVVFMGNTIPKLSFGLGQLCCEDWKTEQIEVNAHPTNKAKDDISWHFTTATLTCTKTGNPAPPPNTADCANQFVGTASDSAGNTLTFTLVDNGEPGQDVDFVSMTVRNSGGATLLSGTGTLDRGNLQIHEGLGPLEHDCSGC